MTECPECGALVRKVYGSVGVVFKGSGFYRTDSRKGASASESNLVQRLVVVVEGELLEFHLLLVVVEGQSSSSASTASSPTKAAAS